MLSAQMPCGGKIPPLASCWEAHGPKGRPACCLPGHSSFHSLREVAARESGVVARQRQRAWLDRRASDPGQAMRAILRGEGRGREVEALALGGRSRLVAERVPARGVSSEGRF